MGKIFITAFHPEITVIKEIQHQKDFLNNQNIKKEEERQEQVGKNKCE